MSRQQVGIWTNEIAALLFDRDETTSFTDSDRHDQDVWKFPKGRPSEGDLVVVFASFDEVLDRGTHRRTTRRLFRVKPAFPLPGQEYHPLWIGPPAGDRKELVLADGRRAIRRDAKPIMPAAEQPVGFDLPPEFSALSSELLA